MDHERKDSKEKYVVGDKKTHNNQDYYFCDCPNHKNGIHWHKFKAEDCRTRKKWLANKESPSTATDKTKTDTQANLATQLGNLLDKANTDDERNAIAATLALL